MTVTPIQNRIKEMASEVFTMDLQHLSPADAQRWLDYNTRNRKLRDRNTRKILAEFQEGRWMFDGMPIRFSKTGILLDGQHRLTALAQLPDDFRAPFVVMRGIEEDAQYVMDQGSKRSNADQLGLDGVKNPTLIASGVKLYLIWQANLLYRDTKTWDQVSTAPEVQKFVAENPWVTDLAENIRQSVAGRGFPFTPSAAFAVAMMTYRAHPENTIAFYRALKEGGANVNSAPNRLRNFGLNNRTRKISPRNQMALMIEHWNKAIQGRKVKHTQLGARFEDPANFPSPMGAEKASAA